MKKISLTGFILILWITSLTGCLNQGEPGEPARENPAEPTKSTGQREWVVQWKEEPDPDFLETVQVLHETEEEDGGITMLVQLNEDVDENRWVDQWSARGEVEFIHPNHKYKVEMRDEASASDAGNRYYLEGINAIRAWRSVDWVLQSDRDPVTVAVVDTGVDMEHPSLKPYLVEGVNLRQSEQPPQDEMGHGTHVAGVIAEVWKGWRKEKNSRVPGRIMPVKVMTDGQDGDVYFTAEGVRESVRRGADVIVLAQGSWTYSETMADAIRFAEEEGVVVVGSSGNASLNEDGDIRYNRPLYYPAALPTVLGVGSVDEERRVVITSNSGPGIDVVAPGESIWAAVPGGGYGSDSGTSFAAPQVAALAALVIKRHPESSPAEVRSLIRQTARPLEDERWNEQYGFGAIDVHAALTEDLKPDIFEPNDQPSRAMPMSLDQMYHATLKDQQDRDCFRIHAPYSGTLHLSLGGDAQHLRQMVLKAEVEKGKKEVRYKGKEAKNVHLTVSRGEMVVCLSSTGKGKGPKPYTLSNSFRPAPDEYENNDHQWNAFPLELSTGYSSLLGTFHKNRDDDWFRLKIPEPGRLRLRVDVWSPRSDPVLYIQEKGGWQGRKVDEGAEGKPETYRMNVNAGSLYVRVSDYGTHSVPDPYNLFIEYETQSQDSFEPNDTSDQATRLVGEEALKARLGNSSDLDWYTFSKGDENLSIALSIPEEWGKVEAVLYDKELRVLDQLRLSPDRRKGTITPDLPPGDYYIRVRGSKEETEGKYKLRLEAG
ncbi:S8 family peptidase [Paludifilum halophilum]|nr:S8 family serine peptidase [Paludifilum halophilum]